MKVHREYIEKSLDYFTETNLNTLDFSGITLAINSNKFKEATERIRDFRRSLAEFLDDPNDPKNNVYRINIQFFPLGSGKDNES